ncbi:MAG: hypothetical protein AAF488_02970 [Planctomycetota bacterium]
MNDADEPRTEAGDLTELTREVTTRFLKMSLDGPKKPIDSLLERLRDSDEPALFVDLIEHASGADAKTLEAELATGGASVDRAMELKNRSVELFRQHKDLRTHLSATAIYFTAIAAALRHHGRKITSQSQADLEAALLDLAATVPAPWDELFISSVESLRKSG